MRSWRAAATLCAIAVLSACASLRKGPLAADRLELQRELLTAGEYETVIAQLSAASIRELPRRRRAEAYDLLGESYVRLGDLSHALQTYQLAEGLFPKDINILSGLANLLHRSDLDDRARPLYERVLEIHPNNANANLGLAEIRRRQGFLARSQEHYEKALGEKGWDRNPGIWRDYAEVLADRQSFKRATEAVHKSLELRYDVDSLLSLARFQRRQGLRAEAYAKLSEAIREAPEHHDLRLQNALWLLEDARWEDAGAIADAVLDGEPSHALARWVRASIRLRLGDTKGARADLAVAAGAARRHPFIAETSRAMLRELAGAR
ncbi:MAG: tetratricopeptide repeat protein [Elusimicrobiota bacterium]